MAYTYSQIESIKHFLDTGYEVQYIIGIDYENFEIALMNLFSYEYKQFTITGHMKKFEQLELIKLHKDVYQYIRDPDPQAIKLHEMLHVL